MITPYGWHEAYKAAVLETDRSNMPKRIQAAESEIQERQHMLFADHGGTQEERHAIQDAISGLRVLRREVSEGQGRQLAGSAPQRD